MTEKYIIRFGTNTWFIGVFGHRLLSDSDFVFQKLLPIKDPGERFYARNIFSPDGRDVHPAHPKFLRKGYRISVVRHSEENRPFFLGQDPMKNRGTAIEEIYRLVEG